MRLTKIMAAGAALSLAITPVLAQAATQSIPSRDGAEIADAEDLGGGFLIPALAIIAIVLGILAATSGGDDAPTSP